MEEAEEDGQRAGTWWTRRTRMWQRIKPEEEAVDGIGWPTR
jgi:hypothetical protein